MTGQQNQADEKITYEEAAERYGVSIVTVRSWARERLISKYRRPLDHRIYVSTAEIDALRNAQPRRMEER